MLELLTGFFDIANAKPRSALQVRIRSIFPGEDVAASADSPGPPYRLILADQ